jgi:hypothetical protein
MTRHIETMVTMAITFMLIAWTLLLVFMMNKLNNEIDYLTKTTMYHATILEQIEINMEPISQFKGLTQYRTFSCTVGDGQMYYD